VGLHVFLRIAVRDADPYLFPLVAVLAAFGLVMLYRIDPELARDQATWFVVGLAAMAAGVLALRDYHVLQRYRYVIAIVGLALLVSPRLPGIGEEVNGAYIQVNLGAINFQPAEISMLWVVVFLASYLYHKREVLVGGARRLLGVTLPPLRHFGPLLVIWGASMGVLALLNEFGMSLMYFGAFLALLYVATARFSFVVVGVGLFVAGAWAVVQVASHVRPRFETWLNPLAEPDGAGYQVSQSFFAQADGGLFGRGFGESLLELPFAVAPQDADPTRDDQRGEGPDHSEYQQHTTDNLRCGVDSGERFERVPPLRHATHPRSFGGAIVAQVRGERRGRVWAYGPVGPGKSTLRRVTNRSITSLASVVLWQFRRPVKEVVHVVTLVQVHAGADRRRGRHRLRQQRRPHSDLGRIRTGAERR
jgi:hypothetical protein